MKKAVFICLVCALLLAACGTVGGGTVPDTGTVGGGTVPNTGTGGNTPGTEPHESLPPVTGVEDPNEGGGQIPGVPSEEEIRAMLEKGEGGIYWALDEDDFARSEPVTIYEIKPYEGYLWDVMFPDAQVLSKEELWDSVNEILEINMTAVVDGQECDVTATQHGISFVQTDGWPASLDPEDLLVRLAELTGMAWVETPIAELPDETHYSCQVDGLLIDNEGYFTAEKYYGGYPQLTERISFNGSKHLGFNASFSLGEAVGTLEPGDLVDPELVKAVCTAYMQEFLDEFPDAPFVDIFDRVELRYYKKGDTQKLLPAYIVTRKEYVMFSDGTMYMFIKRSLIDAQTGEMMRGG